MKALKKTHTSFQENQSFMFLFAYAFHIKRPNRF